MGRMISHNYKDLIHNCYSIFLPKIKPALKPRQSYLMTQILPSCPAIITNTELLSFLQLRQAESKVARNMEVCLKKWGYEPFINLPPPLSLVQLIFHFMKFSLAHCYHCSNLHPSQLLSSPSQSQRPVADGNVLSNSAYPAATFHTSQHLRICQKQVNSASLSSPSSIHTTITLMFLVCRNL